MMSVIEQRSIQTVCEQRDEPATKSRLERRRVYMTYFAMNENKGAKGYTYAYIKR